MHFFHLIRAWFSSRGRSRLTFSKDPDQMEQEILRVIPIGTPIVQAKMLMERNGFRCKYYAHGTFLRIRDPEPGSSQVRQTIIHDVDFLYCDKTRIAGRRWQCALEHKDACVTGVSVSTGLISL